MGNRRETFQLIEILHSPKLSPFSSFLSVTCRHTDTKIVSSIHQQPVVLVEVHMYEVELQN